MHAVQTCNANGNRSFLESHRKNLSRDPFTRHFPVVSTLQVIGIELKDPVTKEPLEVKGLSDPLIITFNNVSPPPDGKILGCNFFDTQRQVWVQTNLTAEDNGNNTLVCKSTHATFFAPSHDVDNNASTAAPTTTAVEGKNRLIFIV